MESFGLVVPCRIGQATHRRCAIATIERYGVHASFRASNTSGYKTYSSKRLIVANSEANASVASPTDTPAEADTKPTPSILNFKEGGIQSEFVTRSKLALAIPWRRVKKGSFLSIKLDGTIAEKKQPRFSTAPSMPVLCEALMKAAYDPRVAGLYIQIEPLAIGWGKVQELVSYIEFFKKSGKPVIAYMKSGAEKEYYMACACTELYVPPTAQLSLRGLAVQAQFLRGVLDKVGVEPQVKRIGKYKSAGDQLLRKDISDAQQEQLSALVDGLYNNFLSFVSKARGKSEEEVASMLDRALYDMHLLHEEGWLPGLKYSDELQEDLCRRYGNIENKAKKAKAKKQAKDKDNSRAFVGRSADELPDKILSVVPLSKYRHMSPGAVGLAGKKCIAIVRETGNITGGSKPQEGQITADPLIRKLRELKKDGSVAGIVLRVDSGGGDALASDLMWQEIKQVAREKPIVSTMGDVAASGGYYMSMATPSIVAHPLTITGSIGVVTGKLNLEELYGKVGLAKTTISRGKFAELLTDNRSFTDAEEQLFEESAQFAYRSFRDKAAASRGMEPEHMEELAQGRVWLGSTAKGNGLVDYSGGIDTAIALVKEAAGIDADEQVTLREVSKDIPSLQTILSSSGALSRKDILLLALTDPAFVVGTFGFAVLPLLLTLQGGSLSSMLLDQMNGRPQLTLDPLFQGLANGSLTNSLQQALSPKATLSDISLSTSSANPIDSEVLRMLGAFFQKP